LPQTIRCCELSVTTARFAVMQGILPMAPLGQYIAGREAPPGAPGAEPQLDLSFDSLQERIAEPARVLFRKERNWNFGVE
jgi:hypothetical protein